MQNSPRFPFPQAVSCLRLSLAFLAVTLTAKAADLAELYDGGSSFENGWWEVAWDGASMVIEPMVHRPGEKASMAAIVGPDVKQWAGAGFETESDPSRYLPVTVTPMDDIVFECWINGGRAPDGTVEGGQSVRIGLGFVSEDGEKVRPKFRDGSAFIPIAEFLQGGSIDADPESWQKLSIPLAEISEIGSVEIAGWYYLAVQFESSSPTSGVYLTGAKLVEK